MMIVDPLTGQKAQFESKTTIIESYKKNAIGDKSLVNLEINNRLKNNNILRFY